jgi:hypothetical protein
MRVNPKTDWLQLKANNDQNYKKLSYTCNNLPNQLLMDIKQVHSHLHNFNNQIFEFNIFSHQKSTKGKRNNYVHNKSGWHPFLDDSHFLTNRIR